MRKCRCEGSDLETYQGNRLGDMCAGKNKKPYFWVLVLASLAVQWLRPAFPIEGAWVRSLPGELRSHKQCGTAKKRKKKKKGTT